MKATRTGETAVAGDTSWTYSAGNKVMAERCANTLGRGSSTATNGSYMDDGTTPSEAGATFEVFTLDELDALAEAEDAAFRENVRRLDVSPILDQFRSWAVTTYGVECLAEYYPIPKQDLHDPEWPLHMAAKGWVQMYDFLEALQPGQHRYGRGGRQIVQFRQKPKPEKVKIAKRRGLSPRRRYAILQRDGFKCGICGRSAEVEGVTLHVDHQQPLSKGGLDTDENLWTLCAECNLGKSDSL